MKFICGWDKHDYCCRERGGQLVRTCALLLHWANKCTNFGLSKPILEAWFLKRAGLEICSFALQSFALVARSFKEEREQIALVAHYKKSNGSNLLFMKEQLLFLKWGFVLSDEKNENWTFFLTLFCFVKVSKSLISQEQHEPITLLTQVYSLLLKSDESYSLLLPI